MTHIDWVTLDPKGYDEAVEVRGFVVDGRPEFVLIRREPDDEFDMPWEFHAVLHLDTDGFGGLEHIDGFATLEEAQQAAEPTVREFLSNPG